MLGFAPLASIPLADDDQSPPVIYTASGALSGAGSVSITTTKLVELTSESASGSATVVAGEVKNWPITATVSGVGSIGASPTSKFIEPYLVIYASAGHSISVSRLIALSDERASGSSSVVAGENHVFLVGFDPPETATGVAGWAWVGAPHATQKNVAPLFTATGAASVSCDASKISTPTLTLQGVASISIGFPVPVEKNISVSLVAAGAGSTSIQTLHGRPGSSGVLSGSSSVSANFSRVIYESPEISGSGSTVISSVHVVTVTAASTKNNATSWTNELGSTTNIHESIDELSYNDADYIKSPALRNVDGFLTSSSYEFNLAHLVNPLTPNNHKLRARMRRANEGTINAQIELFCSATSIASWSYLDVDSDWIDIEEELTVEQAESISNYSNLWVRITGEIPT